MTTLAPCWLNVCVGVSVAQEFTRMTSTKSHIQILRRSPDEGRGLDRAQQFESFIQQLPAKQHVCVCQYMARQL
jgi:hypothetical protein